MSLIPLCSMMPSLIKAVDLAVEMHTIDFTFPWNRLGEGAENPMYLVKLELVAQSIACVFSVSRTNLLCDMDCCLKL